MYNLNSLDVLRVINQFPEYIYWKDISLAYLGCNENTKKLLGVSTNEELLGRNDYDFFEKDIADKIRKYDTEVIVNNKYLIMQENLHFKDEQFIFMSYKSPIVNDNNEIVGLVGISVDITTLHQKNQDDLNMLENIIAMMPGHVYWLNRKGIYLGCNDLQAKTAGLASRHEIIGKTNKDLPWNHSVEGIPERLDRVNQEVMSSRTSSILEETRKINAETEVTFLSSKSPLYNNKNEVVGMVGVSIDITDKKEKEKLQRENEKLEIENKARQLVLEEQEKFRKIVKQVMHDITSPIASIDNILNKLGNEIPENDRVTLKHAANRIAGISQRLLSNYNDDNLDAENEDLLVSLALLQIINEKREEYRESKIIFEVDIESSVNFAFIKHNAGIFKRMISNLVNNSVDALKGLDNGKITVTLGANFDNLVVIVADNGPGMPEHIIEKFKNGISVTEGKENGHGVGLTQVYDAIVSGNGKYKIYASGFGTEIVMWFPKITAPNWLTGEIHLYSDDIIIILDDDKSIHGAWDKSFERVLKEYPTITIKHCTKGQDVINYLNNLTPDNKQNIFLLTDYELLEQGMNGLDVVRQTKMHRAILVTSYATNSDIQDKVAAQSIKMLPKELASSVQIFVRQKKGVNNADIVWLEDQKWYVDDIVNTHYQHLKVDVYYDPVSFMHEIINYPFGTRIILDTYYEYEDGKLHEQTGFDLAKELYALGYTKLILFTGEDPRHAVPDYIHIVRKNDPEAYKNLDKI